MKKKKVLLVCENIAQHKDKIVPSLMFIKENEVEIHLLSNEELDIPFIDKTYKVEISNDFNILKEIKKINGVVNILKEEHYEIVHTFDTNSSIFLHKVLSKLKDKYSKRFMYVDNVKKNIHKLKKVIKYADKVIVNNEIDYQYVEKKKLNSDITVINDLAIDFRKFRELEFDKVKESVKEKYSLDGERKYLTFAYTLGYEKFIVSLIKESIMQNSNICFVLKEPSKKLIKRLEKQQCLENVKIISDIKWLDMLFLSDAIIFPYIEYSNLTMFVYSLIIGIPVIVPTKENLEEYVKDQKNGFFVTNKNVQQTILAVGRSINLPKVKLQKLPEFNYQMISKFSIDKYSYKISNLYKEKDSAISRIYVIEDMKKRRIVESLLEDIKEVGYKDSLVIITDKSKNDEKLESLGIEVKCFNISNFNEKIKLKRFIENVVYTGEYIDISVYGNMNKILRKIGVNIENDNLIARYGKL